jgi:hypothetical protein
MKRSIGNDQRCGGGESMQTPCLQKFQDCGHPAFAWPTLDKVHLVSSTIYNTTFKFDQALNDLAAQKIADGDFENPKGTIRNLAQQFGLILFPMIS